MIVDIDAVVRLAVRRHGGLVYRDGLSGVTEAKVVEFASRVAGMVDAAIQVSSSGLTMWECSKCLHLFTTDDLQQVQPDGHDACPLCTEDDPELITVECVAVRRRTIRKGNSPVAGAFVASPERDE